jgi:hypothetical protein
MILGEFICLLQTGRASDDAAAATPRTG